MKTAGKRILSAAGVAAAVGAVFLSLYLRDVADYKREVRELRYSGVDLSGVEDGSYIGECDVDFIYAKVEVTVAGGKIAGIRILEHRNERGEAAERVAEDMVREQRTDVDVVSGATNSSKVIRKAVENALETD